ncbi:MAG: acylphosphatase [Actinomycetota bacterium]
MVEKVRAHLWISGRVQGVFFRHDTARHARGRGLAGWVRNLADGRVEVVFEGPREPVDSMVRWCHDGPSMALVEEVRVVWEEPAGDPGFSVR